MAGEGSDAVAVGDDRAMASLLLLADARFPSGGHAHSGGMEPAVVLGGVHDVASMEAYLLGRLTTAGLVAAGFAAAASERFSRTASEPSTTVEQLRVLDRELTARTPSPALRAASRRLGRQVLRGGRAVWPHPALDALAWASGPAAHHAVALGAVAAAGGLGPSAAALAAAHDCVVGAAAAAVRLLPLDPFAVHACLGRLAPVVDAVAAEAVRSASEPPTELPAPTGPLTEVRAEHHAVWERRLFAS